jgi:hypothetical protein
MNRYWIINYLLIIVLLAAHSCGISSADSRKFEDSDLDKPVFQSAQPKDTSKLAGTWLTESDRVMSQYTFVPMAHSKHCDGGITTDIGNCVVTVFLWANTKTTWILNGKLTF